MDVSKFPKLNECMERIEQRVSVRQGLLVPDGEDQIVRLRRDRMWRILSRAGRRRVSGRSGRNMDRNSLVSLV